MNLPLTLIEEEKPFIAVCDTERSPCLISVQLCSLTPYLKKLVMHHKWNLEHEVPAVDFVHLHLEGRKEKSEYHGRLRAQIAGQNDSLEISTRAPSRKELIDRAFEALEKQLSDVA